MLLVTQGDAARTAKDIMDSESVFRFGVSLYFAAVLDVVVAWALFRVFAPVSRGISMLAAWFRVVYAGIFVVAISQLVGILHLLNNEVYSAVFSPGQLNAQTLSAIDTFNDIRQAGLLLSGLHLLVIGYLAYIQVMFPNCWASLEARTDRRGGWTPTRRLAGRTRGAPA